MRKMIHKFKGWLTGRAAGATHHANTALVYTVKPGRQESGDQAGADQLALLRRISSFSDKESIAVTAIFPGRPTRKVPDGARQGAVSVRYAAADGMLRVVDQSIKEAGKTCTVVVVTDQPDVLKLSKADGCATLCTATFEKTLDAVAGPLKRESREPRENREPRDPRDNRDRREPRRPTGEARPEQRGETTEPEAIEPDSAEPQSSEPEASEPQTSERQTAEPQANNQAEPAPAPAPAAPRRPHPAPRVLKKETDKAILDLIDPL